MATLAAGVPEASAVRVLRGGAAAVAGPVARRQLQPLQQAHGAHGRLLGLRQCRVRRPDRRAAAVSASFTASNHALFPPVTLISSIAMPFNILKKNISSIAMPFNIIIIKKKHFFAVLRRRIAPTLLLDVPLDSAMMKEEIFGPLLPIITVRKNGERKNGMLLDQQRISLSLSGCAAPVLRSMKNLHSWLVVGGQDRRELRCDQLHAQAAGSLPLQQRRAAQAAVREDRLGGRDHVQRHRHPRIYIRMAADICLAESATIADAWLTALLSELCAADKPEPAVRRSRGERHGRLPRRLQLRRLLPQEGRPGPQLPRRGQGQVPAVHAGEARHPQGRAQWQPACHGSGGCGVYRRGIS